MLFSRRSSEQPHFRKPDGAIGDSSSANSRAAGDESPAQPCARTDAAPALMPLPPAAIPPHNDPGQPLSRSSADSSPMQPHPLQVRRVPEHIELVMSWVEAHFQPGDVIEGVDMQAGYQGLCEDHGLVPHAWNTIAKHLKPRMGRGPRGSRKPYGLLLRADGSRERVRIWIVPPQSSAAQRPAAEPMRVAA